MFQAVTKLNRAEDLLPKHSVREHGLALIVQVRRHFVLPPAQTLHPVPWGAWTLRPVLGVHWPCVPCPGMHGPCVPCPGVHKPCVPCQVCPLMLLTACPFVTPPPLPAPRVPANAPCPVLFFLPPYLAFAQMSNPGADESAQGDLPTIIWRQHQRRRRQNPSRPHLSIRLWRAVHTPS